MAFLMISDKAIETYHDPECHKTKNTTNTGKNQTIQFCEETVPKPIKSRFVY